MTALHRLQEEDPTLVLERNEETHQALLGGCGETHLAIIGERLSRKFLDCRRGRPTAEVAKALDIPASQAVLQVRRLLYFRGAPVVLDDLWLPLALFKGLTAQRLSDYQGPLYGLFEAEFGVRMIRAEEKIRAVLADAESAPLLGVAPGAPLLSVERLSLTYDDRPVELRRGLYDTTHHHYRNELS